MNLTSTALATRENWYHAPAVRSTTTTGYDEREQEEILRSAAEARDTLLVSAKLDRYINPRADAPYPLEYAFHLAGDLQDRVVVDIGCGSGENLVIVARRGGRVTGVDLSPDLLSLAADRLKLAGVNVRLRQASAYDTGLPSGSVDVVLCIAILHHLELPRVRAEILRILRPTGTVIVSEPVRDSRTYDRTRRLFQVRTEQISFFECPLTAAALEQFAAGFVCSASRRFRLPMIPLLQRFGFKRLPRVWRLDQRLLRTWPALQHYATVEVFRLQRPPVQ